MNSYKFQQLPVNYRGEVALRWAENGWADNAGSRGYIYRDGSCSCWQHKANGRCAHSDEYAALVVAASAPQVRAVSAYQAWWFLLVAIMTGREEVAV